MDDPKVTWEEDIELEKEQSEKYEEEEFTEINTEERVNIEMSPKRKITKKEKDA